MRIKVALGLLLVMGSAPGVVARSAFAAEPVASDDVEDQINQGIALRRAGKDEAALGVFLDVEKRTPDSVRVLLHISTAALAAGKWTLASDYMQKALAHKDDSYFQKHKAAIDNVERVINQHVGLFRASGEPAGAEVRLSGELVGTLPMGNPKAVEVGSYMLEVSKPGYFPLRRLISVANDGSLTQEGVDLREQKPVPGASVTLGQTVLQAGGAAAADSAAPATPAPWWRERWVTWSLFGVGLAAGVASSVSFAIRENDASIWNSNACLNPSAPMVTRESICGSTRRNILAAQDVGIATGIVGGVLVGAALVHWAATSPRSSEGAGRTQQGHTECAPGLGGVACFGSF